MEHTRDVTPHPAYHTSLNPDTRGDGVTREDLVRVLAQHGLQEVDVLGDGNCQFHAIGHQLTSRYPETCPSNVFTHVFVRSLAVIGVENMTDSQKERFREELIDHSQNNLDKNASFETCLAKLRESGTWGNHVTLLAIAYQLRDQVFQGRDVRIVVYTPTGNSDIVTWVDNQPGEEHVVTLQLGFLNRHFYSTQPLRIPVRAAAQTGVDARLQPMQPEGDTGPRHLDVPARHVPARHVPARHVPARHVPARDVAPGTAWRRLSRGHVVRVAPWSPTRPRIGPGFSLPWVDAEAGLEASLDAGTDTDHRAPDGWGPAALIDTTGVFRATEATDDEFSLFTAIRAATDDHNGTGGVGDGGRSSDRFELDNVVRRVLREMTQQDLDGAGLGGETLDDFRQRICEGGLSLEGDGAVMAAALSRVYGINVDIYDRQADGATLQLQHTHTPLAGSRGNATVVLERLSSQPPRYSAVVRTQAARQSQLQAIDERTGTRLRHVRPVAVEVAPFSGIWGPRVGIPRNQRVVARQVALRVGPHVRFSRRLAIRPDGQQLLTALCVGVETVENPAYALRLQGIDSNWRRVRDLQAVLGLPVDREQHTEDSIIQAFVDTRRYSVEVYRPQQARGQEAWAIFQTYVPRGETHAPEGVIRIGIDAGDDGERHVVVFANPHPPAPAGRQLVTLEGPLAGHREISIVHDVVNDQDSMYSALFVGFVGLENIRRAQSLRGVGGHRVEVSRMREYCIGHLQDDDLVVSWYDSEEETHPDAVHFGTDMAVHVQQQLRDGTWNRGPERFMLACFARAFNVSVHVYERRCWSGPGALVITERYGSQADRVVRLGFIGGHYVALLHTPSPRQPNPPGNAPAHDARDAPPADPPMDTNRSMPTESTSVVTPSETNPPGETDPPAPRHSKKARTDTNPPGQSDAPPPRRSTRQRTESVRLRDMVREDDGHDDGSNHRSEAEGRARGPRRNRPAGQGNQPRPRVDRLITVTEERAELMTIKTTLNAPLTRSALSRETKQRIVEYFSDLVEERSYGGYWCACLCNAMVSRDAFDTGILNDNTTFVRFIRACYRIFVDTTGPTRAQAHIIRDDMWESIERVAAELRRRDALPGRRMPYVPPRVLPGRWIIHQTAMDTYQTSFENHLWMNYERRLDVLLRIPEYGLHSKRQRRLVLNAIMCREDGEEHDGGEDDNPNVNVQMTPALLALIATERGRFRMPTNARDWSGGNFRQLQDGEPITQVVLKVRTLL